MGRIYVESTPASRGEVPGPQASAVDPGSGLSHEQLEAAAQAAGYRLIPLDVEEPAGNATRDDWASYARSKGATDADLVDADGKDLGQRALRDKYASPAA